MAADQFRKRLQPSRTPGATKIYGGAFCRNTADSALGRHASGHLVQGARTEEEKWKAVVAREPKKKEKRKKKGVSDIVGGLPSGGQIRGRFTHRQSTLTIRDQGSELCAQAAQGTYVPPSTLPYHTIPYLHIVYNPPKTAQTIDP